jgi:hypothetical protein
MAGKVAHGHRGHYKVQCPECEYITQQCRCMAPDKRVTFELCFKCMRKKTLENIEE